MLLSSFNWTPLLTPSFLQSSSWTPCNLSLRTNMVFRVADPYITTNDVTLAFLCNVKCNNISTECSKCINVCYFVWICLWAFNSQMSFYSSPCKNRTDIDVILYGWLCYKCRLSPSTSSHISANLWILEILPISVCTMMNIFTIKWQCRLLPCNTYRIHMDRVGYTVVMHLSIRQTCVLYWNDRDHHQTKSTWTAAHRLTTLNTNIFCETLI